MPDRVEYRGPPRKPEDVIASALANKELMDQLADSLDAVRRGERGTPLKDLQAERRRARSA